MRFDFFGNEPNIFQDISMRSSDCPYTVHFYGAMFREGDVMICMEVMDTR